MLASGVIDTAEKTILGNTEDVNPNDTSLEEL